MTKCVNCGNSIHNDNQFCPICGEKVIHEIEELYQFCCQSMDSAISPDDFYKVADDFEKISGYKNVDELIALCKERAQIILYERAYALLQHNDIVSLEQAIALFEKIIDWKDAAHRIDQCKNKIADIEHEIEQQAVEKEEKKREMRIRNKKNAKSVIIMLLFYVIPFALFLILVVYPLIHFVNGNYAAYIKMYNIQSFEIPEGVSSIREDAFSDCDSLKSVKIPDSVVNIGDSAFYDCDNLEGITIPDNVTSIGDYAFFNCDNLASITIPDSVSSIGEYAFYSCDGFTNLTIPYSCTSIGNFAFADCDGLTNVAISKGVKTISKYVFMSCDNLETITIPNSVTFISDGAFNGCYSLTSVVIPSSVITIGDSAFSYCSSLERIVFEKNSQLISIGYEAFNYCKNLTSITIPKSVREVGIGAFGFCKNIIIEDGTTIIVSGMLVNMDKLKTITIPNSVVTIETDALRQCPEYVVIYYTGTEQQWNKIDKQFALSDLLVWRTYTVVYDYVPKK